MTVSRAGATPLADDLTPPPITSGQSGYDSALPWNRAMLSTPAAVVRAHDAADIADAVRYASAHGLRIAVRSTGHGAVPLDDSTMLVHTASMTDLAVDPTRRMARFGAGVRWQPVIEAAARFGLAPICGSAPGIGAVGYLTGGGIGPLTRTYGVSSDFVRALEVVVGDGRILRATPTENEDLFWGLRGGKATLGIVTAVEMELVPLESFYGGALWFDDADTGVVLRAWSRMCQDLPDQGTSSAAVMRLPPLDVLPPSIAGRQTLAIRFGWVGDPDHGEGYLSSLRQAATPVLDDIKVRSYTQIGAVHSDPVAPAAVTEHSALLNDISDDTVDRLVDATRADANPQNMVELRQLRGAIARAPEHPSAVCHRQAGYSLFLAGPAGPETVAVDAHARHVQAALAPWTEPGRLPNFAASDRPPEINRGYDAATRHRLEELGDHYDPAHVLHYGQVVRHPVTLR